MWLCFFLGKNCWGFGGFGELGYFRSKIFQIQPIKKNKMETKIFVLLYFVCLSIIGFSQNSLIDYDKPTFPTQNLILILFYIKINCNIYVIDF